MDDEAAFLAAIAAAPEDHAPRLVFADWLEEQGDPRAAWLRDPDIAPWMLPRCDDPVPRLVAALPDRPDAGPVLVRLGAVGVPALLQALRTPDPEARDRYRVVLAQLTDHLPPFVPALEADLDSPDPVVRDAAVAALTILGDLGDGALGPLLARLESPIAAERDAALDALGALGPAAAGAVPRVLALWRREAEARAGTAFREPAATALGRIAPAGAEAVPVLADALLHPRLQDPALWALRQFGPAATGALGGALERLDAQGGVMVAIALAAVVPDPPAYFVGLLAEPRTGSRARQAILQCLRSTDAARVATTLLAMADQLGHPDPAVGRTAAEALAGLGEAAVPALPALGRAARAGPSDVRTAALGAMARIDPRADRTLAALRRGLADADPVIRAAAWDAYVTAGAVPTAARVARELSRDPDPDVRAAAAVALGRLLDHAEEADWYEVDEYGVALDPAEVPDNEELDEAAAGAVRLLVRALEDRNRTVRAAAARALAESVPPAAGEEVLDPLLAALDDSAPAVRAGAALALARLENYHEDAVPALVRLSRDDDPEAACAALTALAASRLDDPEVLRPLRAALRDADPQARAAAARGFADWGELPVGIGREVPALLADPDAAVRYYALGMVAGMDEPDADEQAFQAYRRALADPDRDVRGRAWDLLSEMGMETVDRAAADLVRAWAAETDGELANSIWMAAAGCPSRGPALAALLDTPDPAVRVQALEGLVGAGPSAAAAVPALVAELERADPDTWHVALEALTGIGPGAAPAVPHLLPLLEGEGATTAAAVRAVGTFGAAALPALPRLEALAGGEQVFVRLAAIEALATLTAESDRPVLVVRAALAGADPSTAQAALTGLARLGARAAPFVPDLVEWLRRSRSDPRTVQSLVEPVEIAGLRRQVVEILGAIGPAAAAAVPDLVAALEDGDAGDVCLTAARALAGTGSPAAVDPLRRALFAGDIRLRAEAARSLGRLGPAAAAAVPDLCRAALDPKWASNRQGVIDREEALDALAAMGPAAGPAVPTLEKLFADPDEDVRERAVEMLAAIGPAAAAALRRARRHSDEVVRRAAESAGDKS